jgi:putative copper resistance protein D
VRAALRVVGAAAILAALVQAHLGLLVLVDLGRSVGPYLETSFARATLGRVALAVGLGGLAWRLAAHPAGRRAWITLCALALGLVLSSPALSHAAARVEGRPLLFALDAAHQLGVAVWVGGLAHFTLYALRAPADPDLHDRLIARRFSAVALGAVVALTLTGVVLTALYVAHPVALVTTAYGVMVLSKAALLAATLGLGYLNFRLVRRATVGASTPRLARLVEVELGLVVTALFAAASLTSLPPAVDIGADRATMAEVAARFTPASPRLHSPPIDELLRGAEPLMAPPGERTAVERAWSEFNHHWAGLFVLVMGLLALAERCGVGAARHWPAVFLAMAVFLAIRNDPRAWPLGPAGFWESMVLPDVLQHRAFVVLLVAFGVFEWRVRTGRLRPRPWGYVFPLLCAAGGGLLLTHSHAMFSVKEEFLTEITHAPLGLLGAFAGWGRWIELRLPEAGPAPGWVWRGCLTTVGLLLLLYREG